MIVLHTFVNLLTTIWKPCKDNEYLSMTPLIIQLIYAIVIISGVSNIPSLKVWVLRTPNVWNSLEKFCHFKNHYGKVLIFRRNIHPWIMVKTTMTNIWGIFASIGISTAGSVVAP